MSCFGMILICFELSVLFILFFFFKRDYSPDSFSPCCRIPRFIPRFDMPPFYTVHANYWLMVSSRWVGNVHFVLEVLDLAVPGHEDAVLDLEQIELAPDAPDVGGRTVLEALNNLALVLDDAVLFAHVGLGFRCRLLECVVLACYRVSPT
jgi:hypothetical protein